MPELSPSIIAFLSTVMIFGGFSKGTIGFGLIMTTVPFLSLVIPPKDAMAWMATPILILNIYALILTRAEWRQLPRAALFIASGILIVPAGVYLVVWVSADITRAAIGLLIFFISIMRLSGWRLRRGPRRLDRPISAVWGALTGLLHGSLMMAAPPIILYLNYIGVRRDAFVFLVNSIVTAFIFVQIVTFSGLGAYASGAYWQSLLLLAPAVLGMWLGNRFRHNLSEIFFEKLVLGLLGFVGVSLMARNLWALF